MNDNIFVGIFPGGLLYADRQQEVERDYKRIAFLCYETLELTIEEDCPDHLAEDVREHAARLQAQRGLPFRISGCGKTVTLGAGLPRFSAGAARLLAAFEHNYVANGYLYSGSLGPQLISVRHFEADEAAARRALDELSRAGVVVRRRCREEMYELPAPRRAALIIAHRLHEAWEADATARVFAPNEEEFGEVTCALREAGMRLPAEAPPPANSSPGRTAAVV